VQTRFPQVSVAIILALALGGPAAAETPFEASVNELRQVIGEWNVVTEEINPDGSLARAVDGTYSFEWVIPDRVVAGRAEAPAIDRVSALLFYVSETEGHIEMVSVAADGRLWIMTGELGGDTRYTQTYPTRDGATGQLRFTRYNVSADSFESKMEYTTDDGTTWMLGNHQVFTRK
jgi:hypothetical protein